MPDAIALLGKAMSLPPDRLGRFARHIVLLGDAAMDGDVRNMPRPLEP